MFATRMKGNGVLSGVISGVGSSRGDFALRTVWTKSGTSSKDCCESIAYLDSQRRRRQGNPRNEVRFRMGCEKTKGPEVVRDDEPVAFSCARLGPQPPVFFLPGRVDNLDRVLLTVEGQLGRVRVFDRRVILCGWTSTGSVGAFQADRSIHTREEQTHLR